MDQLDIEFLKNTDSVKWHLNHGWTVFSYLALQRIIREVAELKSPIKERLEQILMQYEIDKEQELMIVEALADLVAIAQNELIKKMEQEGDAEN